MTEEKLSLGKLGEEKALSFLKKKGYRILAQNYRCRVGEIDIIARDGKIIAFVEVKTRTSLRYGSPFLAVDLRKQKKIARVAVSYLKEKRATRRICRFDVVGVTLFAEGEKIELIKDAFRLEESNSW